MSPYKPLSTGVSIPIWHDPDLFNILARHGADWMIGGGRDEPRGNAMRFFCSSMCAAFPRFLKPVLQSSPQTNKFDS